MRSLLLVLVLAVLLVAWSEAAYYPLEQVGPLLVAFYALPVWALTWCVRRWPPAGWEGIALAGAVYGFVVEGVLVPVLYEAPLSTTSYTSLAWHLLVSVAVALVGIGHLLRDGPASRLVAVVVALGVLLGLWWPAWWSDAGGVEPGVAGFAVVMVVVTGVSAAAHAALSLLAPSVRAWLQRRPARIETSMLAALVVLGWLTMSATNPIALVQLPLLLAACAWGLRRVAAPPGCSGAVVAAADAPLRWRRLPTLALVPCSATATYAALASSSLAPVEASDLSTALVGGTQWLLGYAVFAAALLRARHSARPSDGVGSSASTDVG